MNILVVDDDGTNRRLLRVKLEEVGHRVFEAEDGMQAFEVLAREPVEGIISDVLMPNVDGYRFCLEVRKNACLCSLPFIIYTSTFASPGDERLALEAGADDYLKKPAPTEALVQALERAAATRSHSRPYRPALREELYLVRGYSDLLVKKLEEKHHDLQQQTEQLRQSEGRSRLLAAIVESSEDAIISQSLDGTVLSWNDGAVRLLGYTAGEMIGKSVLLLIPPDRLEEWQEQFGQAKRGVHVSGIETVRLRKNGRRVEVAFKLSPIKEEKGEIVALSAIISDITQRKALERELALREQRLRGFFGASTAGMAILDADLRFLQVNEALAAANGLPAGGHLGQTVREVIPDFAPAQEPVFQKVLLTGEPVLNFEVMGQTPARPGVNRHWVASYFPIRTDAGRPQGLGAVVVEVTAYKRAEGELRNSREQLRALAAHLQMVREEERTRISREIHDELGQILTGLKMDLRWVEKKMVQSPAAEEQKALEQKIIEAEKLADSSIEAIHRIAADLRPGILDNFGLSAALEFEARRFEQQAGIQIAVKAPEELRDMEREVATAIFRIFQETLTNVARHAGATNIDVRLRDQNDELVLEVKDNGKGIAADAASKRTSLGLVGMSERVRLLGGHMYLHGARHQGTTVTVRIPRVKPSPSS